MQVARTAASGADREVAGEVCLGPCREGGDLFVPHVNPLDFAMAANCVGDAVETVAHDAEYALDAGRRQGLDELIRYRSGHTVSFKFAAHQVSAFIMSDASRREPPSIGGVETATLLRSRKCLQKGNQAPGNLRDGAPPPRCWRCIWPSSRSC